MMLFQKIVGSIRTHWFRPSTAAIPLRSHPPQPNLRIWCDLRARSLPPLRRPKPRLYLGYCLHQQQGRSHVRRRHRQADTSHVGERRNTPRRSRSHLRRRDANHCLSPRPCRRITREDPLPAEIPPHTIHHHPCTRLPTYMAHRNGVHRCEASQQPAVPTILRHFLGYTNKEETDQPMMEPCG